MFFKVKDRDYWQKLSRASLLGLHLVSGTFVGLLMGYFLDKWLHTQPWLTMIFLLFGIIAGFRNMYQEVKKIQEDDSQNSL